MAVWCFYGERFRSIRKVIFLPKLPIPHPRVILDCCPNARPFPPEGKGAVVKQVRSGVDARKVYKELSHENKVTIVIQDVDWLYGYCEAEVCKELGITAVGESKGGVDWAQAREKLLKTVMAFSKHAGVADVILTFSSTLLAPDIWGGRAALWGLPGRTHRMLLDLVNHLGYCYMSYGPDAKPAQEICTFAPSPAWNAGSDDPALSGAKIPLSYLTKREPAPCTCSLSSPLNKEKKGDKDAG